jgi:hypothetical protein
MGKQYYVEGLNASDQDAHRGQLNS